MIHILNSKPRSSTKLRSQRRHRQDGRYADSQKPSPSPRNAHKLPIQPAHGRSDANYPKCRMCRDSIVREHGPRISLATHTNWSTKNTHSINCRSSNIQHSLPNKPRQPHLPLKRFISIHLQPMDHRDHSTQSHQHKHQRPHRSPIRRTKFREKDDE